MTKPQVRAFSYTRFVLGLFAAALFITSALLFWISYIGSLSIADREVERFARSEEALVRLVFEQRLSQLDAFLRTLAVENQLRDALEADDLAAATDVLERATLRRMGSQFEILVVDRHGAPDWANASYSIFRTDELLPADFRQRLADGIWQFRIVQRDGQPILLAAVALPVVRPEDGRALGRIVGGYVFNDSLPFMAALARALDSSDVMLIQDGTVIARIGGDDEAENLPETVRRDLARSNHLIQGDRLYVRSRLAAGDAMSATHVISVRPSETLKNVQATYRDLFAPFLLYVVAGSLVAAFTLHRVTMPALSRLVSYAQKIRNDTTDVAYDPGRIKEFNALGTALQDAFTELRDTDAQFRALIDGSLHGVSIHANDRILYVNDALLKILGYDRTDHATVIGMRVVDLFAPEEHERLNFYTRARSAGTSAQNVYEARAIGKDGQRVWVEIYVRETRWNGSDAFYITIADISERKRQEELIVRQANYDALTGLPNRHLFRDRLIQDLARAEWDHHQVALLFLDLDRFKNINDTLGHSTGDELIVAAAKRISQALGDRGTVARLGGDEFAMILPEAGSLLEIEEAATRVLEELARPLVVGDGTEVFSTASIGITVFPADGLEVEMLLRQADTAMYHAKADGGNAARFFSAHMNEQAAQAMETEHALRRALERRELHLNFQPIIDRKGNTVAGCEALVRWTDPVRGPIAPRDFIPVAEATGLIVPLGAFVLEEACRFVQDCLGEGIDLPMISVNVSARQCRDERFIELVRDTLSTTGLDPARLHLEITESVMFDETASDPVALLQAIRALGVKLSLDDFGTGYSSLSNLRRFPIDILKIDRSFVRDLEEDAEARSLAQAIVGMADSLGLEVIAEGAETSGQCDVLLNLGCHLIQGFHLGRPMTADAFRGFLRNHATGSSTHTRSA
uniref:putative bifunctional diguanylate cyclase/phosphodiesterase n=1 Tax=Stappia sp. TaxID=1870903 RepID=UPI003BA86DEB